MKHHLLPFFIFTFFIPAMSYCSDLEKGFGYPEVLKMLGAPKEKIEYETSREMVWIYDDMKLRFKQGKLQEWSGAESAHKELAEDNESEPKGVEAPVDEVEVQDILSEIINDAEDGSENTGRPRSRRPRKR